MGTGSPGVRTIQAVHVGLIVRNAVGPVNKRVIGQEGFL